MKLRESRGVKLAPWGVLGLPSKTAEAADKGFQGHHDHRHREHAAYQGLISASCSFVGRMSPETQCLQQKIPDPSLAVLGGFNLINFKRPRAYW